MPDVPAKVSSPPPLVMRSPRREPAPYKLPWRTKYNEFVAERICEEIASGRTIERISIEEPWAPSARQIHLWMVEHQSFSQAYQFARELRAEKLAEDILDVAYDLTLDPDDKRIIISAHQWLAGKMNRNAWGDKQVIEQTVTASVNTVQTFDVSHLTLDEMHAAERAFTKMIEGSLSDGEEAES